MKRCNQFAIVNPEKMISASEYDFKDIREHNFLFLLCQFYEDHALRSPMYGIFVNPKSHALYMQGRRVMANEIAFGSYVLAICCRIWLGVSVHSLFVGCPSGRSVPMIQRRLELDDASLDVEGREQNGYLEHVPSYGLHMMAVLLAAQNNIMYVETSRRHG